LGITISYWKEIGNFLRWKQNEEHKEAQQIGKERWYQNYKVRISKVERDYSFEKNT
jgi:heme-degrading monooxygenase HmoA